MNTNAVRNVDDKITHASCVQPKKEKREIKIKSKWRQQTSGELVWSINIHDYLVCNARQIKCHTAVWVCAAAVSLHVYNKLISWQLICWRTLTRTPNILLRKKMWTSHSTKHFSNQICSLQMQMTLNCAVLMGNVHVSVCVWGSRL